MTLVLELDPVQQARLERLATSQRRSVAEVVADALTPLLADSEAAVSNQALSDQCLTLCSAAESSDGWPLDIRPVVQVKAEKHASDDTIEEMQAHTVKTVKILHHGEEDDEEPEKPKSVPKRGRQ